MIKFAIRIFQALAALLAIALVVLVIWFGYSVVEVWMHNAAMISREPFTYSDINLFNLLLNA